MSRRDGLTTVELMVTLFVAALFILSGYQLYNAVNLRAGNSREMSEASNIAYRILREQAIYDSSFTKDTSSTCPSSSTLSPTPTLPANTLPNPVVSVYRCYVDTNSDAVMAGTDSDLQRVTVQIEYGNDTPKRKVVHATYVSPS